MQVYHSLDTLPKMDSVAVSIGNFDGVHLGHLYLLEELKKFPNQLVITFSNHPLEVLKKQKIKTLTTIDQKTQLLEKQKITSLLLLRFDKKFAKTSYEDFLSLLLKKGMCALILGKGSRIGADRKGDETAIGRWGEKQGLETLFLPKKIGDNFPISTSAIKRTILDGNIELATKMLGYRYMVSLENIENRLLPIEGKYTVELDKKQILIVLKEGKIIDPILPKKGKIVFTPHPEDKNLLIASSSFLKSNEQKIKTIQ